MEKTTKRTQVRIRPDVPHTQGRELRGLVAIVGEDALNERDVTVRFLWCLEDKFLRQTRDEDRSIDETLDLCWTLMASIDTKYLVRLDQKWIEMRKVIINQV